MKSFSIVSILCLCLVMLLGIGSTYAANIPNSQSGVPAVGSFNSSFSNSWGTNLVTVYYPQHGGPYPAVVFAGGWLGFNWAYSWIGDTLANNGYVAAVVQVPNIIGTNVQQWADAIKGGITYLQNQKLPLNGVFGAAGHSMGGAGVFLAASQDSRISAVVSMAPPSPNMALGGALFQNSFNAAKLVKVPVQVIVGSSDLLVPPSNGFAYYSVLSPPKEIVEITGATHVGYTDFGSSSQHSMVAKYMVNWFDYYLKGNTSSYAYIFGSAAQHDLSTRALTALNFVISQ